MMASKQLLIPLGVSTVAVIVVVLTMVWPHVAHSQQKGDVLTQHSDNYRTGANLQETILTPESIKSQNFGKLFDLEVDGQIYTQPLVVSGVEIDGQPHDIVLVGTQNNSLYVFDTNNGETLWQKKFGEPAVTPNRAWNRSWGYYTDVIPKVGIISTPVIDRATNTVYFTFPKWVTGPPPMLDQTPMRLRSAAL